MRIFVLAVLLAAAAAVPAQAQSCGDLWYQRNAIYKDAGYCFKTNRAIRAFGNAGCRYDNINDVPLSANDRARVADIVRTERDYGCR
ncbi:MAG: YARHG domain-containing protein [Methylobacteriaceae bacterium]|nr:YARHG domain-containing protein [Methylobacteriaceae bacterium]